MTTLNCNWDTGVGNPKSVHLVNDYTGIVSVAPLTTEELELRCGSINQSAATAVIQVTSKMYWTGGVLDSSPDTPSQVVVTGIGTEAFILSRDASLPGVTLQTGSLIRVKDFAILRFGYGTVQFNGNSTGIKAETLGAVQVVTKGSTTGLALTQLNQNVNAAVTLDGGLYNVVWDGTPNPVGTHTSGLPFDIKDSSFLYVAGGITMKVTGRLPANGPSVRQTGGYTDIVGGSKIEVPHGYVLSGGKFNAIMNAADTFVTVTGNMTVNGTNAEVSFSRTQPAYTGILRVEGDVNWSAGKYLPSVTAGAGGLTQCLWQATETFTIGAGAQVLAPVNPGQVAQGDAWTILKGDGGIVGTPGSPDGYTLIPDDPNAPTRLRLVKN